MSFASTTDDDFQNNTTPICKKFSFFSHTLHRVTIVLGRYCTNAGTISLDMCSYKKKKKRRGCGGHARLSTMNG